MVLVFLQVTGKAEDIIDVADAKVEISQDAVHQSFKGGAQIFQAEAGVVEDVGTKRHDDCCLWNVLRVDWNLVVPLQEIQLAEDSSAMEAGVHISHGGQRVAVRFGDHIKTTLIATRTPGAVVFLE